MKKLILSSLMFICFLIASAKEPSWVNADYGENYEWWVFVSDNIKLSGNKYDYVKVWVKWEYTTPEVAAEFNTTAHHSLQLYEFTHDFSEFRILKVADYDKANKLISQSNQPSSREYIVPESVGASIAETAQEIIRKAKEKI